MIDECTVQWSIQAKLGRCITAVVPTDVESAVDEVLCAGMFTDDELLALVRHGLRSYVAAQLVEDIDDCT